MDVRRDSSTHFTRGTSRLTFLLFLSSILSHEKREEKRRERKTERGEKDSWMEMPPTEAVNFWEKTQIEPFSPRKDVFYALCCPEDFLLPSSLFSFFREVNTLYELCNLGQHSPCPSLSSSEGLLSSPSVRSDSCFHSFQLLADSCLFLPLFPSLSFSFPPKDKQN